jgi:hypothetical protein
MGAFTTQAAAAALLLSPQSQNLNVWRTTSSNPVAVFLIPALRLQEVACSSDPTGLYALGEK